jgi:hypothetical protein
MDKKLSISLVLDPSQEIKMCNRPYISNKAWIVNYWYLEFCFLRAISILSQNNISLSNALNLQEKDIVEYASKSLQSKPSTLWLLPPVLIAAAIPPWWAYFLPYGMTFNYLSLFCDHFNGSLLLLWIL